MRMVLPHDKGLNFQAFEKSIFLPVSWQWSPSTELSGNQVKSTDWQGVEHISRRQKKNPKSPCCQASEALWFCESTFLCHYSRNGWHRVRSRDQGSMFNNPFVCLNLSHFPYGNWNIKMNVNLIKWFSGGQVSDIVLNIDWRKAYMYVDLKGLVNSDAVFE